MRVLFLAPFTSIGGGERQAVLLGHGLEQRGHQWKVFFQHDHGNRWFYNQAEQRGWLLGGPVSNEQNYISQVGQVLFNYQPDAVITHDNLAPLRAIDKFGWDGLKVIWQCHTAFDDPLSICGEDSFSKVVTNIVCVSQFVAGRLTSKFAGIEGIVDIIYNGTPRHFGKNCNPITTEIDIPQNNAVAGSVGRFSPNKGMTIIAEGIAMRPGVCGLIGGWGMGPDSEEPALRDFSRKHNQVSIFSGGVCTRRFVKAMDIFMLASETEGGGVPLVVQEAMMMKVPVISTKVSDMGDFFTHGESILFLRQRNRTGIFNSITNMLMMSPEERSAMAENAHSIVSTKLNAERMVDKYERLLQR